MEKKQFMAYMGATAICIALAPTAAGCGKPVLPGLLQSDAAKAEKPEAQPATQPTPTATYQAIVGLWLSTATVGGQPFAQGFETFTSDGTEVLNVNIAPQEGNVCLGVWAPTGRNTLALNHPSWNFDNNGNVVGTIVIKAQITLEPGGNTYKGTFTEYFYDLNGKEIPSSTIVGQLTGTRIAAN